MGRVTITEPILIDVSMWDDSITPLRVFAPRMDRPDAEPPLVIVWPGYGMGARYYDPIAKELAARGFYVATSELHGQGASTARATREHKFGYHQMASSDFPRSLEAAKEHFGLAPDYPTYLLCHSKGGQIATLFAARPEAAELGLRGVMGVGSGSPYWKGFYGRERFRMRYGTRLIQLVVKIIGYQPDGILDGGGYGRQSGVHVTEWLRYLRTNRLHDLMDQDMDYEAAKLQIRIPILLTRCSDDEMCPIPSAKYLADSLPSDYVAIEELPEALGHNKWARKPETVVNRFEQFVTEGLPRG